jgi:radical SAM superfamily enzyme YgiQ (UPF0313 family)
LSGADELWTGGRIGDKDFISTDLNLIPYRPNRIQIQTSYGCRNRCKYCAVSKIEGSTRVERPVSDVITFIKESYSKGYKNFRFLDSNILDNWDSHFKIVLKEIISLNLKDSDFTVYGGVETNRLTEEMVELMCKARFSKLTIPLESSDDSQLKEWGRTNTISKFKTAVETARKYFPKERITAYIMIGYPGQTYESALAAVKLCEETGCTPDLLAFTPIPGTSMERKDKTLESLNPMLWPCAWEGLTVPQIEDLFSKNVKNFNFKSMNHTREE